MYDPLTKLVRFRARDDDPEIGRWTAKAPNRFASGDGNLYAYVGNNPVNWVDPSGLWWETPLDLISLGTGIISFGSNMASGSYGAAALDAAGIVFDIASVLSPTPGGAGLGLQAMRAAGKESLQGGGGRLASNGGDEFVDDYRAVSKAEAKDIVQNGFRPEPLGRSMEDKWFSGTSTLVPELSHAV